MRKIVTSYEVPNRGPDAGIGLFRVQIPGIHIKESSFMPLAQDNFDGRTIPDSWGIASDGQTWQRLTGNSGLSVGTGTGRAQNGSQSNTMTLGPSATDVEVTTTVNISTFGNILGPIARCVDGNNFYYLGLGAYPNTLTFGRRVAGAFQDLILTPFTTLDATSYRVKLQVVGAAIKGKAWLAGDTEPGGWAIDTTDTTFASGLTGIFLFSPSLTDDMVDDFLSVDLATPPTDIRSLILSFSTAPKLNVAPQTSQNILLSF